MDDEGFGAAVEMAASFFEDAFDLVEGEADDDAVASIGEFSWFDDPDIIGPMFLALFSSFVVMR